MIELAIGLVCVLIMTPLLARFLGIEFATLFLFVGAFIVLVMLSGLEVLTVFAGVVVFMLAVLMNLLRLIVAKLDRLPADGYSSVTKSKEGV